jgi:hypothetical protein
MGTQDTKYIIYKISDEKGKSYIGATKEKLQSRVNQHKRRAKEKPSHPFYAAILKYGISSFSASVIDTCNTKEQAEELEIKYIAEYGLENLYNISPGGKNDIRVAGKEFWKSINTRPEEREAYTRKLCEAQRKIEKGRPEAAIQWCLANPRQAYKNAMRASRLAKRVTVTNGSKQAERDKKAAVPLKERLLLKHKGIRLAATRALLKTWENRSEEEIKIIGNKISKSLSKRFHEDTELKAKNKESLIRVRESIDREKQVKAARQGIKKYWEDLKSDPIRYAEYLIVARERGRQSRQKQLENARKRAEELLNEG